MLLGVVFRKASILCLRFCPNCPSIKGKLSAHMCVPSFPELLVGLNDQTQGQKLKKCEKLQNGHEFPWKIGTLIYHHAL